ncbi:hypothetical protein BH23GEM11_BH23GEM11_13730 [soil metagenome]
MRAWRAALLTRMLRWATGFLGVAWAGGTAAAWFSGLRFLVVANTLAYAFLLALTVVPGLSYRVRAWGILGLCWAIGIILLVQVGPLGAGILWLAAVPVLASFLFGLVGAWWGLGGLALTLVGLSIPMVAGVSGGDVAPGVNPVLVGYTLVSWGASAASVLGLSALLALPFARLLDRAEEARSAERRARFELEAEAERRSAAEAELRQAHKLEALGTFAGGIAHDFNNLLVPMLAEAEDLCDTLPRGSPGSVSAHRIRGAAQRARELVRGILTFSRGEGGAIVPMAPGPLLEEIATLVRPSLPDGVTLVALDGTEGRSVPVDPMQVHRILMNLARNAWFAMKDRQGVITLELGLGFAREGSGEAEVQSEDAEVPPTHLRVRVSDTGVGMDAETRRRALDPFFTTRAPGSGSGLGLSTVHGIADAAGGRVDIRSAPEEGTTVDVWLPLATLPGDVMAAPSDSPGSGGHGGALRVLLVDDDSDVRRTLRRLLERLGHEVTEAEGGREALAWLTSGREGGSQIRPPRDLPVHLVITDHSMPGMTGVELAGALHAQMPGMPVVLISGHPDRALQENPQGAHLAGFLAKPFGRTELEQAIRRAVTRN